MTAPNHAFRAALILLTGAGAVPIAHSQTADPMDEFRACARQSDRTARIDCYEELGGRVLAAERAVAPAPPPDIPAEPAAAAQTVSTAAPADRAKPVLPDDIGGAEFEARAAPAEEQDRGLVTSCKQDKNKKWYFYFDNGQVWMQSDSKRRRYRDCNFLATIVKDGFGYKMYIDGVEGRVRVSRRK